MHSHHIVAALAEARVAGLQRAATSTTETAPRRRRRRALALLGLAATAAFAVVAPGDAFAKPIYDTPAPVTVHEGAPAPAHDLRAQAKTSSLAGTTDTRPDPSSIPAPSQDLRPPDVLDAVDGRGTFNSPEVVVVKAPQPRRPAPADGIDWGDAGLGAGSLLGLAVIALGAALLITHRRRAAHGAPPAAL